RPIRIAYSTAVPLTTGSEPGSPSEVGVVFSFAPPPKVLGASSNIFVAVPSSTCTSMPRAGSYVATASVNFMSVSSPASGARRRGSGGCRLLRGHARPHGGAVRVRHQRLESGTHLVEARVLPRGRQQLEPHGHAARQSRRQAHAGDAG